LLDRTQVVDFGIFSVKQNNTPNTVFADYVAEIVEFNGEYSLERDGKSILNSDKLKKIQDGDIVSFPE
jgi:dynactin complex subunit